MRLATSQERGRCETTRRLSSGRQVLWPALEMDVPTLVPWEPVLLGIGRTYRQKHAEAVAPQAKTQSLLRSGQIQLVDIHRMEVPASIQLTAIVTPVIEGHDRTVLRSLTLTGALAVKPLLALLSLLKAKGTTLSTNHLPQ